MRVERVVVHEFRGGDRAAPTAGRGQPTEPHAPGCSLLVHHGAAPLRLGSRSDGDGGSVAACVIRSLTLGVLWLAARSPILAARIAPKSRPTYSQCRRRPDERQSCLAAGDYGSILVGVSS